MKKKNLSRKRKIPVHASHLIFFFALILVTLLTLNQLQKPQSIVQKANEISPTTLAPSITVSHLPTPTAFRVSISPSTQPSGPSSSNRNNLGL